MTTKRKGQAYSGFSKTARAGSIINVLLSLKDAFEYHTLLKCPYQLMAQVAQVTKLILNDIC